MNDDTLVTGDGRLRDWRSLLPEVERFYGIEGNGTGGGLHIVLDDGNVEDRDVQWCLDRAIEAGDREAADLACLLLVASRTQRTKVYRNHRGGPWS